MPIDVEHVFTYHPPTPEQIPRFEAIRKAAKQFAQVLVDNTPEGTIQDQSILELQKAVMAANMSIALGSRIHVVGGVRD